MDCIVIGVAGGTGSGKSTFTNRLKNVFGDSITVTISVEIIYRLKNGRK